MKQKTEFKFKNYCLFLIVSKDKTIINNLNKWFLLNGLNFCPVFLNILTVIF